MRTTVTVVGDSGASRTDAWVEASAATPVGAVLASLARLTGAPPTGCLRVDGLVLDPLGCLADSGLRDGSVVAPAGLTTPALQAGCLELRVLGGPASGHCYLVPPGRTIIGRGVAGGIPIADPAVSRAHLELDRGADGVMVRDLGSANGSRLGLIAVGTKPRPFLPGMRLRIGDSTLGVGLAGEPRVGLRSDRAGGLSYNRPPRLDAPDPASPRRSITFPLPPAQPTGGRLPLIAIAVPLVIGVTLAALLRRPEYLLFTALSPVMAVGQWLSDRIGKGKTSRADQLRYCEQLAAAEGELVAALATEQALRRERSPDPAALLKIARTPSARLWERRRGDADFLQLSLGSGSTKARVLIDGTARAASCAVDEVPIVVELRRVGVLGLAGHPDRVRAVARFTLGQLATLHSPRDLRIVLLTHSGRADSWDWLRWLPHLSPEGPARENCQALIGFDADTIGRRLAELAAIVESRQRMTPATVAASRSIVILLDGARAVRGTPGLSQVLSGGPSVGIYAICLDDDEHSLPEECGSVAVSAGAGATHLVLRHREPAGSADCDDIVADGVDAAWSERLARSLAPLRDGSQDDDDPALPVAVRWIELAGLDRSDLGADLTARWTSKSTESGGSTRVLLGQGVGGPVFVDLAADGPHALVAGTTGAGKSELLQTLVAALACANRPDELTFVLVDYKGGAAFGSCAALPHTIGLITDLDGSLVERALVSLGAELRRRESLLAVAGAAGIEEYRLAGGRLARLVIVVDEFAALAEELPEFVSGLVGVAQRGRSLGVHLVLATQRPEGVVNADIRANTNLRVCLSVLRDAESRDVIDAPDAARISRTTPGRAYARTGHGELQAFQAGRVGGVADAVGGPSSPIDVEASPFRALAHPRRATPPAAGDTVENQTTDLDLLVAGCGSAAHRLGIESPASPWLEPLPAIALDDEGAHGVLAAVIGLQDLPSCQARRPLVFDLATQGHLLIAGSQRSGRTTAVRTLMGALARTSPVRDVQLYAFDSGGGLAGIDALPHCGGVVGLLDPDRATRLIALLTAELLRRQTELAAGGCGSIADQRAAGGDPWPHIVVAVDGWESFLASFDDVGGGVIVEGVYRLIREGAAAGLHVVVTTDRAGLVGRLASMIDNRLVLRLADPTDFSLIGIPLRSLPTSIPPGRGFWVDGLVLTQVCLLATDPSASAQTAALAQIGALAEVGARWLPKRVDPVPSRIAWTDIADPSRGHRRTGSAVVTLGIGGDELRPVTADLVETGPGFVVSGPARSGRSTALATIAANLRASGWRTVGITPRPSVLREFAEVVFDPSDPDVESALFSDRSRDRGALAVLVDDAELVADSAAAAALDRFIRRARDSGELVVIGGTTEDLAIGFRGFVVDARRCRSGLLLSPRGPLDGEVLGVRLPRAVGGTPPAGRGIAVLRGEATRLQVALPA